MKAAAPCQDDPTVPTVPAADANELAAEAGDNAELHILRGPKAGHVFGTPNPFAANTKPSLQLGAAIEAATTFAKRVAR